MVSNINGDIEAGDYITTSTETVEFNGKTYKIYLIAVVYTSG